MDVFRFIIEMLLLQNIVALRLLCSVESGCWGLRPIHFEVTSERELGNESKTEALSIVYTDVFVTTWRLSLYRKTTKTRTKVPLRLTETSWI